MPQLQETPVYAGMPHQHTNSTGYILVQGEQNPGSWPNAVPEQSHVLVLLHCL